MAELKNPDLCDQLRERFAVWHLPLPEDQTDPEVVAALRRIKLREEANRRTQFDNILSCVRQSYVLLSSSKSIEGFRTIRDKVTAHSEIQCVADKYQPVDISKLNIKWCDMRDAIKRMQGLVEEIGLLIRNTAFAWDALDEQLSKASNAFWLPADSDS